MKNMIIILSVFFFITGCNEEQVKQQENSIFGTWKLIKRTANNINGTANDWENINNGFTLNFKNDFVYESNESTICQNNLNEGSFSLNKTEDDLKDILEIIIKNCDNNTNGTFVREFYYRFSNNNLILEPKEPACDEGCGFLYEKVD